MDNNPDLKRAILSLRISAVLYGLLGLLCPIFFFGLFLLHPEAPRAEKMIVLLTGFFIGFISLGMAIFVEIVCRHLKQKRYWAWIAGLILSGIYIPSCFIVMGIISLLGLIRTQSLFKPTLPPAQA